MCGRYYRRSDKQRIAEAFRLGKLTDLPLEVAPSFNIAPTTMQAVIVADRDTGERTMRVMRWGLIPVWAKDPKAMGLSTINAKAEGLMDKPMWRTPFKKRRCLVPADGFYEWKKLDAKTKQPYAFQLKEDQPLAFGGVWEAWKETPAAVEARVRRQIEGIIVRPTVLLERTISIDIEEIPMDDVGAIRLRIAPNDDGENAIVSLAEREYRTVRRGAQWIETFSIVTTEPNELTASVHNRMPVMLKPSQYERWLDTTDQERPPVDLLRPYDAALMSAHVVDPRVGNVRINEPSLCQAFECPPNSA
ncbi:putative SOS response-associated peptidase YedK [Granulicella aggregans]|uniref:Abasic site processing protein n=1 Tax=Granulicella aggregans TaxID=474949 RepID=A0A7W7ZIP2_9BACT|nr:SOS response-associated peptidase [Granulicella aggregans]MBB5060591.1 putative SOS response-associated peptidase YedK [Granulicella aggregans]